MCLKPSKSKKQHRDFLHVTRRQGDRLVDPVVQKHSIGQTSEAIMLGRMRHLQRHRPGHRHVAHDGYGPDNLPSIVVDGGDGNIRSEFRCHHAG